MTPAAFYKNHLYPLGRSYGIEQIEMNLLSLVLKVRITVVRLSAYKQSDFITTFHYNISTANDDKVVLLISEDDRHYNILR